MHIGIIGAGNIGQALARQWIASGHSVVLGSRRRPEELAQTVMTLGDRASAASVADAAAQGDVVLLAIPYGALEDLGPATEEALRGKLVLDACNPFETRDGDIAVRALKRGSGLRTAELVPGARVVKAFNTVHVGSYPEDPGAGIAGERIAVPLAGAADDVAIAAGLVEDAGFEPVPVGPLEAAALFEPGTGVWNSNLDAAGLRRALFRRDTPDGEIVIYRSPVIDGDVFDHGFPERTGGLSKHRRRSLNLGYRWGDDESVVEDNRRLVAEAVGYEPDALVVTKHVHGTAVWTVGEPLPEPPEFDGLATDRPGAVLGAFAADCVPIVFADSEARVCGAAHAGWRGTVNGAAVEVVKAMTRLGARAADIRVALGPCIGPCCFEVGPEVVEQFRGAFGDVEGLVVPGPRKDHVDLRVANRLQLERSGIAAEHIDSDPPCTRCHPERFFSYRRDGFMGGVHMGFIRIR